MAGELVFLTGGSGFLGRHVGEALLAGGYRVRALVRSPAARERLPGGAEAVEGDLRSPGRLVSSLRGCRYLVHVAAHYSFAPGDARLLEQVNVAGTAGLLEAARQAGIEKAVVTSSSATVGPARGDRLADEDDWADMVEGPLGAYHESKLRQERAALAARLPVVSVLPTAPVGAGDWRPTPTGKIVLDYARGRMFAYLPGGMNVVAVEDAARAHLLALERGRPGRRYLVGAENLTLLGMFQLLEAASGVPAPRRRLPGWAALGLAHADGVRTRLRRAAPAVPLEGVRMGFQRMWVSWERARRELGYEPRRSVESAFADAVGWYRTAGKAA